MKFKFPYKGYNPPDLLRRCGYGQFNDPNSEHVSYTRRLGRGYYPRFHVYIHEFETYFELNLHLDQKQASYQGHTAHSGEYDGEQVENEARRITAQIAQIYGM